MDVDACLLGLGVERYEQAFRDNDIEIDLQVSSVSPSMTEARPVRSAASGRDRPA